MLVVHDEGYRNGNIGGQDHQHPHLVYLFLVVWPRIGVGTIAYGYNKIVKDVSFSPTRSLPRRGHSEVVRGPLPKQRRTA